MIVRSPRSGLQNHHRSRSTSIKIGIDALAIIFQNDGLRSVDQSGIGLLRRQRVPGYRFKAAISSASSGPSNFPGRNWNSGLV
jgi:hypothetical protein